MGDLMEVKNPNGVVLHETQSSPRLCFEEYLGGGVRVPTYEFSTTSVGYDGIGKV